MREAVRLLDTGLQPWEALSDVLQRKLLNGDPDAGPHTMLLRSSPRDPGPDFAQYHSIDEELLALGGDFTFDGRTWFKEYSYAFYPANFVHGAQVHVRGGYCVYLRQSGPSDFYKVDEPETDTPYYTGEGESDALALQYADARAQEPEYSIANGLITVIPLHRAGQTGAGSSMLIGTADAAGTSVSLSSTDLLELFTVSGSFSFADHGRCNAHSYHCDVAARPRLSLQWLGAGVLMISHEGPLRISL